MTGAERVQRALEELSSCGRIVLRPQDSNRLPPFLVADADQATPELVGQFAEAGQGQVYLALSHDQCERLGLRMPVEPATASYNQLDAIDARAGIGSGLSAADRAYTIRLASSPAASAPDFKRPGHVVPLRAARHGVLERTGPTEAAVDLIRAANGGEGAVISPLFEPRARNLDSSKLPEVSVDEVIAHRWRTERLLTPDATATLPTAAGSFRLLGFREEVTGNIHLAFVNGDLAQRRGVLASYHTECLLGSHLHGELCECSDRLEEAIARTQADGGILIYTQISHRQRRDNPLASCEQARRAAGETPAPAAPAHSSAVVTQILGELKIESVRWLGPPLDDAAFEVVESLPYSDGFRQRRLSAARP